MFEVMQQHEPPQAKQYRSLPEAVTLDNIPTITGAGRGRTFGIPTINLDLSRVPSELKHGVYACTVSIDGRRFSGAMSYGPRPTVKAGRAMEIHLIDETLLTQPAKVSVSILAFIRGIRTFSSTEALVAQIRQDIVTIRGILTS
jgi:riboflavin kinase/FMN adenylyltransferase